jgi:hypothetical protein
VAFVQELEAVAGVASTFSSRIASRVT